MRNYNTRNKRNDSGTPLSFTQTRPSAPVEKASGWTLLKGSRKFSQSFTTWLNPTETTLGTSTVYPIINGDNSKVAWNYLGKENLSGNIVDSLLGSVNSTLVSEFDSLSAEIELKYLFLAYNQSDVLSANNMILAQSIMDATALANSEMFTQLAFATAEVDCPDVPYFQDAPANAKRTVPMLHYQTTLQNLALVLAKVNQFSMLQQDLVNMGFQREADITMDLLALFNKKQFKQKFVVLSNHLANEFFDYKWFQEFNKIANVATRKSNSIRDPLATIRATYTIPEYKMRAIGATDWAFDSAKHFTTEILEYTQSKRKTSGPTQSRVNAGFRHICFQLIRMLDQRTILEWARGVYMNNNADPMALNVLYPTINSYFNRVVDLLEALRTLMSKFTYVYSDLRTYLQVANRAGLVSWSKGTRFDTIQAPNFSSVANNVVITDLLQATLATPDTFEFNEHTQTWQFNSLWTEYEGIPTFDTNSAGAFLTVSTKTIGRPASPSDVIYALPKLFDVADIRVQITNRVGLTFDLESTQITGQQLVANPVYSRLAGFQSIYQNRTDHVLRVPYINLSSAKTNQPLIAAAATRLMQHFFGIGRIHDDSGDRDYLSENAIAIIDGQMTPVVADMIDFLRNRSPLKSATSKSTSLNSKSLE